MPLDETPTKLNAQQLTLNTLAEKAKMVKIANQSLTGKNMQLNGSKPTGMEISPEKK